jgi:DNA helicase-2/ATP-dependent DNA helicase PcrA
VESFTSEYKKLNPAQRQAVDIIDGPLLVVAGPGTGKTQLLSLRVANILRRTDVHPHNILCLTYTESGKEAMLARLSSLLGTTMAKRVEVHTFHGFGTRLINRFPEYFPELSRFRPAEDLTLYETLVACMGRLPRSNPLSKHAYGQFTYQADASDRISQLKRAGILPETALDKAETDIAWCKDIGRKLTKAFNQAGRLSAKAAAALEAELGSMLSTETDSDLGKICLEELSEALQNSAESGKTSLLSAYKKKWFSSEEGKLYFKPADQLKKLLALAELYQDYENELKKRSLYDYDDMILYALAKLQSNPEFLAAVQETFQYILADEYQDTNAAQATIINIIAANPVNEGRPNVMVVGDDDQAIYGFQGALGDVLMDFRERWRDVQVITLKDNYRSTSSIINTARAVITRGENRLENHYEDIDKSLNSNAAYPNVLPMQFEAASADAVVEKAVSVAKSSTSEKQLAIIATKHKYLRELADKLDAAKVRYYYEGREDLLSDPAMVQLLLLADMALAIRQNEYAHTNYVLPEVIANELVEIPRPAAWRIALEAKAQKCSWWEALSSLKEAEAKAAATTLKELAKAIDPSDALASLKTIASQFNFRVLQKIRRLLDHAATYYGRENISLSELLRYAELCRQAGVSLEQTVVKGSKRANVVLLSAHRSKGLEFDRVFILHADYYTWFKEGGRRNNLVLPEGWKYLEPLAATTDDRLRLLYVVMTRAKQELALIKGSRGEGLPGVENIKVEQHISQQLEAFSLPEEQSWRNWYVPVNKTEKAQLKAILAPVLQNYRLSATHLTTFLDIPHGGPVEFLTSSLLGIPEPIHPEAVFGNYVHRTLHFAQNYLNTHKTLPDKTALETFIKTELSHLDENRITDITETVDGFLHHSSIMQPGGVGEYSFTTQNIEDSGVRLTGTVDQFVVNDGILTLTDYKTGRALNSWRVTEDYYKQKLHRFRQQLMIYERLFKLSQEYQGVEKIVSKVAFVEPNRRDAYYELKLDASDHERHTLEALLPVVWKRVMDLDLPDISGYSQDMQGIEAFEKDLLEGDI